MRRSRYREERTLVRGLCRAPGQDRRTFKQNVNNLHRHFERFNVDVSELCQWLMSLRPNREGSGDETGTFWRFITSPDQFFPDKDSAILDRCRLQVFEIAVGWRIDVDLPGFSLSPDLSASAQAVNGKPLTPTATKMLERLKALRRVHVMVLLRAAAEWIAARYLRGMENWERQREEWLKEKIAWEEAHPQLAEDIRLAYNNVFKSIGVLSKRPRVCSWERLSQPKNNCEYAGERFKCGGTWKNHGPLCVKFKHFLAEARLSAKKQQHFVENAEQYLKLRKTHEFATSDAMRRVMEKIPQAKGWFPTTWKQYLEALGITEQTIIGEYGGRLHHCLVFDGQGDCEYNPHTFDCAQYHRHVSELPQHWRKMEGQYREWRRDYLAGPKKPAFRYPSSRTLPVAKVFGRDFYEVDFETSILGLRLDDMNEGEYISFGFKPWPIGYDLQPHQVSVSSVGIHFVGTRARTGFRFKVSHRESRLAITQDEIDELRSRAFPRAAQDQSFLDEARRRLIESFAGNAEGELNILTVDLGDRGGAIAVFKGRQFQKAEKLDILKTDKLRSSAPKPEKQKPESKEKARVAGLGRGHVGLHLEAISKGAAEIAERRNRTETDPVGDYDMRRLTLHIAWMIRDWVRLNAAQVIKSAEENNVDLIVFESMRGFRAPGYDKLDEEKKRRLAFFAFGSVRRKVAEKAVERGMRVVTVPYLYSSQHCAECGKKQEGLTAWDKNKRKGIFQCEHGDCKPKAGSDENAARVLGRVFWGEIMLPVSHLGKGT